jgi:hypothetical protein
MDWRFDLDEVQNKILPRLQQNNNTKESETNNNDDTHSEMTNDEFYCNSSFNDIESNLKPTSKSLVYTWSRTIRAKKRLKKGYPKSRLFKSKHSKPQERSQESTPIKENDYLVDNTTITATLLNTLGGNDDNKYTNHNNDETSISESTVTVSIFETGKEEENDRLDFGIINNTSPFVADNPIYAENRKNIYFWKKN